MASCRDCFFFTQKAGGQGECRINGPVEADRDSGRCPSRSYRPKA